MKKIVLGLLVGFLLASGTASAASVNLYRREASIGLLDVRIEDTISFDEAPGEMEIPLMFSADEFSSRSTIRNYECGAEEREYGTLISCDLPEGESGRLTLEFTTDDLVSDVGQHYYFSDELRMPAYTETFVYRAELREGLVLIEEDMNTPFTRFSPGYGEERSDGRIIYVFWSEDDVQEDEGINPRVSYERTEEPEEGLTELYVIVLGIVLILGFMGAALKLGDGGEGIPQALKEDERKIVEIVEDAGGEIKQKRIVEAVEFSKAKVSRLVHDLKERGLLETKKVGRTNRVRLRDRD